MMFADFFLLFKESVCIKPNIKKWFMCSIIIWDEALEAVVVVQEARACSAGGGLLFHISARGFHLCDWDLSLVGTFVNKIYSQINSCSKGQKRGQQISAAADFWAKPNNVFWWWVDKSNGALIHSFILLILFFYFTFFYFTFFYLFIYFLFSFYFTHFTYLNEKNRSLNFKLDAW